MSQVGVTSRHDLTDERWRVTHPLILPQPKGRGRLRADDRTTTLNGINCMLKTGASSEAIPSKFDSNTSLF
ncbi:MAG: transposase [Cyanobacteria bacterium P01_D01_bin.123]